MPNHNIKLHPSSTGLSTHCPLSAAKGNNGPLRGLLPAELLQGREIKDPMGANMVIHPQQFQKPPRPVADEKSTIDHHFQNIATASSEKSKQRETNNRSQMGDPRWQQRPTPNQAHKTRAASRLRAFFLGGEGGRECVSKKV
ncbi:hypothetical protein Nepgr_009353 [Nepenthes gracilis]|uniref:Uncharacterized protein n=1 Tax=Nepenthes gracilis TaxID=150966 RepID=A0AAD3XK29_NEPGR|nr:hypothetical protein Nepgr_009353 [Nepenthes gracilis]